MSEFVRYKRSLASKGKKPKVATPSTSSPSVTPSASPTVVCQVFSPYLLSIADDYKINSYVHSALASMLSQPSGQVTLGSNPFLSAPSVEVPDIPSRGPTGGRCAESLSSRLDFVSFWCGASILSRRCHAPHYCMCMFTYLVLFYAKLV